VPALARKVFVSVFANCANTRCESQVPAITWIHSWTAACFEVGQQRVIQARDLNEPDKTFTESVDSLQVYNLWP